MTENKRIFLALIIFLGLVVRLLTYTAVFDSGKVVFLETDPYYHMWRVFSYINIFPRTFLFDNYINYPYGALVGWPPLFDQSIAFVSLVLGLGKPSIALMETTGAFFPVVLGLFSILLIYCIAKQIFNENIALFASLLLAVMPAHVMVSFLGFTDHHIAEVLLSVLAYLLFIKSLTNYRFAILSGVIIGISFLTWNGAPIFAGMILLYTIVQFILDRKLGVDSSYLVRAGGISFLTALMIILLFYLWIPWLKTIQYNVLSYFQLIYLSIFTITIVFLGFISSRMKNREWYHYVAVVMLFFAIGWVVIANLTSFYQSLSSGIGYLLRLTPVLKQIHEAQPLFFTYDGRFLGFQFFSNPAWYSFTFCFYVAIAAFLYLFYDKINRAKLFFIIWTIIAFVLTLSQRRFTYILAVNIAILSGYFIDRIKFRYSYLILLILIIPNIVVAYQLSTTPPKPSQEWYTSLVWMREHTSKGGVMAWWDYGNWILYISKKPVVANNFQIGGEDSARFFLAKNESYANEIMKKRKARYVIVDRRMGLNKFIRGNKIVLRGAFASIAGFAGEDISSYLNEHNLPNNKYFQTMYAKLHVFDGNGLKHYRMIYESEKTYPNLFDKPTKDIKIFEYVNGARIKGNASYNQRINLSAKIITNQKRIFYYHQETKADKKGNFEFVVPYSKDSPYETRLIGSYVLSYDNITYNINIKEEDVLNGNIIVVK